MSKKNELSLSSRISVFEEQKAQAEQKGGQFTFELHDIGLGTLRTSATYAALLIQLEGSRWEQIRVLDSVMDALGITPEEITLNRQMPDVVDEVEHEIWERKMAALAEKAVGK